METPDRINVIKIEPGDTLVLMHPKKLPEVVKDNLLASMNLIFPDNEAMVLDEGMTLDALRSQDARTDAQSKATAAEAT